MDKAKHYSARNGKIEFLRFVCCMIVLIFHLGKYIVGGLSFEESTPGLFPHGAMSVEFFFVVSGYLMAKSIYKKISAPDAHDRVSQAQLSVDYVQFIFGKIRGFFTEHALAFIITITALILLKGYGAKGIASTVFGSIPSFLLIQMSGIRLADPNHVEWYLSCMLFAMAFLYPICRKYYYSFTRYFAPIVSFLTLGYMMQTTSSLTGVTVWTGVCYKSLLRALCEISLGTTVFEISRHIADAQLSKGKRIALTALELTAFAVFLGYTFVSYPMEYEFLILGAILVLVTCCFSGVTYGNRLFDNPIVYHLGKMSLPIYLTQLSSIYLTQKYFIGMSAKIQLVAGFVITIILAYAVYFGAMLIKKQP